MAKTSKASNQPWIKGLQAVEPEPKLKEKLMLFGQFVGDWDIVEARYWEADGTEAKMKGEVHFGWILGGTAVQDVWMGRREGSEKMVVFGTTVRFYDEKIDAWRSTWLSPLKGLVQLFIGHEVNGEIVLDLQNTKGYPVDGFSPRLRPPLSGGVPRRHMTAGKLGC